MKWNKFGVWLVFVAAMLWATDAPFRVFLTKDLSASAIVLAEHAIGILCVLPLLWWKRAELRALRPKEWVAVLIIAIGSSALASVAFTKAFSFVSPSVAILLQKLQPLLAISLAAGLLGERLRGRFWLWCGLALLGAYLISFSGFLPHVFPGEKLNANTQGVLYALLAAGLWAAGTVLGRLVLSRVSFQSMTALRFIFAFLFLCVWNVLGHTAGQLLHASAVDWLYLAVIALASGVVSLLIYYKGLSEVPASVATIAELGFPMAAVLVNFYFLHDKLVPWQLVGMALLLYSVSQLQFQYAAVQNQTVSKI
jgi:drug/metabolite transporter (DMT)-like permease